MSGRCWVQPGLLLEDEFDRGFDHAVLSVDLLTLDQLERVLDTEHGLLCGGLRVSEDEEDEGLDVTSHGETGYKLSA